MLRRMVGLLTLTGASFGRLLASFVAFHRVFVCAAGIDAPLLGLLAGIDAGILIGALCPG